MSELIDRVKSVIADQLGMEVGSVKDDSKLIEDCGADSLDCVEIVMAMEEEFEVTISDEKAEGCKTPALYSKVLSELGVS